MASPADKVLPAAAPPGNGEIRELDGESRIFYDGYWIRHYEVPDTLAYKKRLIDSLTRRVFHHAEPGINTPGRLVEEVRTAYEQENDPLRRRVLAAMLAGALLNRGTDILTRIVELERVGMQVNPENDLIRECGLCFMGALEYGKNIRPMVGKEGLDELWGEPFKAFSLSVSQYLETRYLKIAQTMGAIDTVVARIGELFSGTAMFGRMVPIIGELGEAAKLVTETMRSDYVMIEAWPRFVGASDRIADAAPDLDEDATRRQATLGRRGIDLIHEGGELIVSLAVLRVPLPRTTQEFLGQCGQFEERYAARLERLPS